MNWSIVNSSKKKIAYVNDRSILTIGNTNDCDIILPHSDKNKIFSQIFLHDGFIFEIRNKIVSTYFLSKKFYFLDNQVIINFKNTDGFFLNSLMQNKFNSSCIDLFLFPNLKEEDINERNNIHNKIYESITKIFSLNLFKITLLEVQNELSQYSISHLNTKKYHYFDIVKTASTFLDTFYWKENSIFDKENIYLFKRIIWCVCAQINDFGILTLPLIDEDISEILVNNAQKTYFESKGQLSLSPIKFDPQSSLMTLIERICTAVGRKIDESTPFCDARLPSGARVHAIIPPLSLNGPCLTIRKFPKFSIDMTYLIENSSITKEIGEFLNEIVLSKKNILISGGTGTGKTTFLNCLSSFIPQNERIITIEDSAELQLQQLHIVRLETRIENSEKAGAVTIRTLLKNALRMRPDRIIIGECRGEEALDMLQAMNTGHDGSMTTIHANSPRDALLRLETLVMFASQNLPSTAIREQISTAIHYIIQLSRLSNGKRCVTSIHEVVTLCEQTKTFLTKPIYEFNYK
ncbi:CpaF family protein [Fluviispira multicolorata]|nr:CpaF family protein [Fluviispira multicolorata]